MDSIAALFSALADPNRIRIVNLLLDARELCVCDIERVLALPQARVSRHLTALRAAGLVSGRRQGQWMHYALRRDSTLAREVLRALKKAAPEDDALQADLRSLRSSTELVCLTLPKSAR